MFFQVFSQLFIMKSLFFRNPFKKLDEEIKSIIEQDLFDLSKQGRMNEKTKKDY